MADTIDTLQIEISATANDASKKIDALVSSLNKLKNSVKGTAGLDTLAQRIKALADATNSLTSSGAKNLSDMATALQLLSTVQKPKSISTIAKNLESLGNATNSLSYDGAQALMAYTKLLQYLSAIPKASGLSSTVNALSKLKSIDFSGISEENMRALASALNVLGDVKTSEGLKTTLTQLNRIPKIMEALDSAGLEKFANQMKEVASAMKPLADEMDKIARGFDKFPSKITSTISAIDKMSTTAKRSSSVFGILNSSFAKFGLFYISFDKVVDVLSNALNESNEYVETLNLFNVSMGEFYEEALDYANLVSEKLKIDPSQWMRAQGTFMSMAAGFGVSREKAYQLSESLTELSYDISSLYNEDVESSVLRLQSALAGEIEPIRRLGISISEASLQEYALSKGIDKTVNSMTEQEKALLRSTVLIERAASIGAVGDFVKTIESPANALRILKQQIVQLSRSIGNLIIPVLIKVIPYVQAFVEVLTDAIQALALLVGWELPKWDANDWGSNITGGFEGIGTSADEAADSVKKLKDYTTGIDELNIISPDTGTDNAGGGAGGVGGSSWFEDMEIPDLWDKDFIKDIETQTEDLKAQMQDLLKIIGAIGAALLAWKIGNAIFNGLNTLSSMIRGLFDLFGLNKIPKIDFKLLGLGMLLADAKEFAKYWDDIIQNGPNFSNVVGLISESLGLLGDTAILLGNLKLGGALKIAQGIGEIVSALADIGENGANLENVSTVIRGITNIAIGIGAITGNIKLAGAAVAIQGLTSIIEEIGKNWDAIKKGDWSGVDKGTLIIGAIEVIGGILAAMGTFSSIKNLSSAGKAAEAAKTASDATQSLDTTVSKKLSPNLSSLAKNLGLGLVIVAEVAAASLLIVGSIALMGKALEQVGIAWKPVIENGGTVAAGMGIGVGILAAIGTVTALLGSVGTPLIVNIALGTAILAELGIATGLFVLEIWAIGKGLDEIGQAWQPVLDNGETIATGIGIGTGLLVGIGVVTAALGAVTVASAGTLPAAIAIGTAILVELAVAFVAFNKSLVDVADALSKDLAPSLDDLNQELPALTENMSNFTTFMSEFAGEVSSYTKSMGSVTWSSLVSAFQSLFAGNPILDLSEDVNTIYSDTLVLNEKLNLANPELETAIELMTDYVSLMTSLKLLTEENGTIELNTGIFTNLYQAGYSLVTGFEAGVNENAYLVTNAVSNMIGTESNSAKDSVIGIVVNNLGIDGKTSKVMENYGKLADQGIANGITDNKNLISTAMEDTLNPVLDIVRSFAKTAESIVSGVLSSISSAKRALEDLTEEVNSSSTLSDIKSAQSKYTSTFIRGFATGGFPEHGDLFFANESGPELVGKIGNRTAVANGDQIVSGIQVGVETANAPMVSVLYQLLDVAERIAEKDNTVQIGDEVIGASANRYNSNKGYNLGIST